MGGTGIQQYRVFIMPTTPQCSQLTYNGRGTPWSNDLMSCDRLSQCYKSSAQCKAQPDAAVKNLGANPLQMAARMAQATALEQRCKLIDNQCFAAVRR